MKCSLTCACVSSFLLPRSFGTQKKKERKKSTALRPECRAGCIYAKDMRCSLTCACVSYFLLARSCIMQERKERKKSSALRPQCRTGCIHAKDMKCSLTCACVFYFPGLAYSPVRENKNVTFSMLTCVACMRSLTGLTSHVHVVLQPLPLPSTLSSALLKGYVVAALGTFNMALRSARSGTT